MQGQLPCPLSWSNVSWACSNHVIVTCVAAGCICAGLSSMCWCVRIFRKHQVSSYRRRVPETPRPCDKHNRQKTQVFGRRPDWGKRCKNSGCVKAEAFFSHGTSDNIVGVDHNVTLPKGYPFQDSLSLTKVKDRAVCISNIGHIHGQFRTLSRAMCPVCSVTQFYLLLNLQSIQSSWRTRLDSLTRLTLEGPVGLFVSDVVEGAGMTLRVLPS